MWIFILGLIFLNSTISPADTSGNKLDFITVASNLNEATSIYITPDEELFVVESGLNRLLKLNRNGGRLDSLGRIGFGDYRFDRPVDVDATNGLKIYVSDYNNRRIQIFDRRLQFLSSINLREMPSADRVYRPTGIVVNAFGELFILDEEHNRLVKIDRNGRFEYSIDLRALGVLNLPVSMVIADEMIFLSDPAEGIIHMISGGNYLRYIGGLKPVFAMSYSGRSIWAAGSGVLYEIDRKGRVIREMGFSQDKDPVGIASGKNMIYLLSNTEIRKATVQDHH